MRPQHRRTEHHRFAVIEIADGDATAKQEPKLQEAAAQIVEGGYQQVLPTHVVLARHCHGIRKLRNLWVARPSSIAAMLRHPNSHLNLPTYDIKGESEWLCTLVVHVRRFHSGSPTKNVNEREKSRFVSERRAERIGLRSLTLSLDLPLWRRRRPTRFLLVALSFLVVSELDQALFTIRTRAAWIAAMWVAFIAISAPERPVHNFVDR
jgi:hypothetical protein